ncbi:hypothetical protein SLS62_010340 [Diatrype stigma]|uniref:AAA+ ATPase domain-containing protein n=1 Tax=Diatrype stigma TaxID=117547 RepID=A0AAN9UCW6_9PEZI
MESFPELEKRVQALEQRYASVVGTVEDELDRLSLRESETASQDDQADKRELNGEELKGPERPETDLLKVHVKFRKEILHSSGDLVWVKGSGVEDSDVEVLPSQRKSFRYAELKNGKLLFYVERSTKLYEILLGFYPPETGQLKEFSSALQFNSIFPLVHCRDRLKELENSTTDDRLRTELRALDLLYERKHHFRNAKQQYDKLQGAKTINHELLRGLFSTDQLVVFRELRDEWAIARVKTVFVDEQQRSRYELELACEAIDFDGKTFRTHTYRKEIENFVGTKNITELAVYPLSHHPGKESLIEDSIKSGRIWKALHDKLTTSDGQPGSRVMQYVGYCEAFPINDDGIGNEITGRVVVDSTRYPDRDLLFSQDNTDPFKRTGDVFADTPENNPLVLCPKKVLVYSLSDNEWYYVAMQRLEQPTWVDDAWSRLVVSPSLDVENSVERIRKLAKAHMNSTQSRKIGMKPDNFRGKGKGLTFLLHGPPGVGKTMTAECLSEELKSPLYRINLGMLVSHERWESKIEEIFKQAHFWNAILLIDEAEVVMSERTVTQMSSLAWVAVFLRKIEYFEGILFLTTNQIHMIDPAFISRVNLGVRFPELDHEIRLQIWQKLLGESGASSLNLRADGQALEKFAEIQLNGRQIRNVIYSARLLADPAISGPLTKAEIDKSLKDVINFMDMIKEEKHVVEMNHMSHWS